MIRKGIKPPPKPRHKTTPLPEDLAYLLDWYNQCRNGQARGQEREPLSHQEILAFRTLHLLEDEMDSFDVQIMRRIDGVWFKITTPREVTKAPAA